uniref:Rho GTPase-activating protein 7 n=1 Tax=Oryzias latipes TaxID=8090 RepID=A0A3P9MQ55_ORYLA
MPVAIRKRSWEEHVTHPSGLQYSYDDLDLVCCHGVDSEGPGIGSGDLKQGRRLRCASLPEGCHQLPTNDHARSLVGEATTDKYITESEEVTLTDKNEKIAQDLLESVNGSHKLDSQSQLLQTTNPGTSETHWCKFNSMPAGANSSVDTKSRREHIFCNGSVACPQSSQCHICNSHNVFKSPHICREGQQYISISSNKRSPLCGSACELPGKLPDYQETKESHTEGYSRPPEISRATLNPDSVTELRPHANCPDVVKGMISTSDRAGAGEPLAVELNSLANERECCDAISTNRTMDLLVNLVVNGDCAEGRVDGWSTDSADKLDGMNDSAIRQENTGLDHHSRDVEGEQDQQSSAGSLDQVNSCKMLNQTLMKQHDVEVTVENCFDGKESAKEDNKGATLLNHGPSELSDNGMKRQCCSLTGTMSSNQPRSECLPVDLENTGHSANENVKLSFCQSTENCNLQKLPQILSVGEDCTENCSSKLDTIPEITFMDQVNVLKSETNTDAHSFTQNPIQFSHLDDEHKAPGNPAPCSKEVSESSHGNQTRCLSESPAAEVTDGHREHCRPEATVSTRKEVDKTLSDIQLQSSVWDGTNETGHNKADNMVKVRMRKREHARLDSMVLLLMKLDQLDQEIENALIATSSVDRTPTLHRQQRLEADEGSLPAASQAPPNPHFSGILSSESTASPDEKPENKSALVFPEKEKREIEAKEACTWLRAAGFPQYAQLYEDAQFPIDISSVTRDHDFLDRDAIEALCRRLNTLNKCALMRLDLSPQRKRSEDSDEDEPCAISGRWTFQRDSKRWSRMEDLEVFSELQADPIQASFPKDQVSQKGKLGLREGNSSESVLTDLSEQTEVGSIHSSGSGGRGEEKGHAAALLNETIPTGPLRANSVASMCSSSGTGMVGGHLDRGEGSGKSARSRAKSFLKRMESLRLRSGTSSKRKKKTSPTSGRIEISGPVIKEGFDDDKLRKLNCVDISSINLNNQRNPTQTMTLNRNRSLSYSTQTSNGSTGSTGSSQSEASSGSAVSTPSPVTRARSHSTAAGFSKRGGMYLEGFDPFSFLQQTPDRQPSLPKSAPPISCQSGSGMSSDEQNCRSNCSVPDKIRQEEDEEDDDEEEGGMIFFYLPEDHKPGTFPKDLHDGNSRNNNGNDNGNSVILRGRQSRRQCCSSSGSVDCRLSFYDNVPYTEREEEEGGEHKLEEVLQHVSGLQRFVNAWSEAVACEEEEEDDDEVEEGDSDSALDSASPCPSSPLQNRLEETENGSDQDSTGNPLGEAEEGMRERRDSGVGASLTRTSRPQKLRWPSFQNSHRPSLASAQLQISCQSVLQMNLLQKLSLLQLTALLEKHTPTNKHGFSWAVPKFMKRIKVRDHKDRNVFGVSLQVIVQRTGQPLPQGIQQAMRYLRNNCLDQVGLFRKSGVKSRIQALRQMNEASGADGCGVNYEGQSAYDVADMLKQYFRDLPEPLFTSKLSETFLQIYQYMPKELRLQATRAAVLLLPDENREALRTLMCLLSDVTASVAENQMTPTNLAVCLAPSLFHLNTLRRKESSSPRVMNRKQTLGKPDQRDLNENLAATHGLTHMIQECRKLFRIPEEMNRCRNSYVEQALLPKRLEELGNEAKRGSILQESLDTLLKEAKDKFRGYDSCSTPEHVELAYRKVNDGFPLRQWKVTVEIHASPEEILTRVLREQGQWDEDLLESRVVETLDQRTEVYQYVRNTMAPHPTRDHVVLRTWVTDLPKGACALVSSSVDHDGALVVGVRANVLTSRTS